MHIIFFCKFNLSPKALGHITITCVFGTKLRENCKMAFIQFVRKNNISYFTVLTSIDRSVTLVVFWETGWPPGMLAVIFDIV